MEVNSGSEEVQNEVQYSFLLIENGGNLIGLVVISFLWKDSDVSWDMHRREKQRTVES